MTIFDLAWVLNKYELKYYVIEWAGILRYLGTKKDGFTLDDWLTLSEANIDNDLGKLIFDYLIKLDLLNEINNTYFIYDDLKLQRSFEMINNYLCVLPKHCFTENESLLWTIPKKFINMNSRISSEFKYLHSWINNLIQKTEERLIFFAPYYSISGINQMLVSIETLLENKDVTIDWIVSDITNEENINAFEYIKNKITKDFQTSNIRFYKSNDINQEFIFHAKLLLSDSRRGYMGSANFSKRGLDTQFELGISLDERKTKALSRLIDFLIKTDILVNI